MRERLLFHLRLLPQIVESWNKPDDGDTQPSQFAKSLTKVVIYFLFHSKEYSSFFICMGLLYLIINISILFQEVSYLQRVLSRMLHEADVQAIFR